MKRATWISVGGALVLGFIAGFVSGGIRDRPAPARPSADACIKVRADHARFLNQALVPWRDVSFGSSYRIPLRAPLNGLTIVGAEVDGPGSEGVGDMSLWASPRATPPGWLGGAILYALDPVARRVDGRSTYPGTSLRQFKEDGEAVYDPRVIRAIAPIVAASCIESPGPHDL